MHVLVNPLSQLGIAWGSKQKAEHIQDICLLEKTYPKNGYLPVWGEISDSRSSEFHLCVATVH